MLEPIPFWGMIEVNLPVKTYAGNKPNNVKECMNKPVAWTDKRQLSRPYPHSDAMTMWVNAYPEQGIDIPLYTNPVKELTDEEIDECSCFVDVQLSQRYGAIESIDDIEWTITGLRAFARAILRKAQEK